MDKFSKWVEIIPLRLATAEWQIQAFRERILSKFRVPKEIFTDKRQTSKLFQHYL